MSFLEKFSEFIEKYKKIILIIMFCILIVIIGYFIYFIFFMPAKVIEQPGGENATSTFGKLPKAGKGDGKTGVDVGEENVLPEGEGTQNTEPSNIAQGGLTKTTSLNDGASNNVTLDSSGNSLQYYNDLDGKFYKIDDEGNILPLSDKVFYSVKNVAWSGNKNKAIIEYPDGSNIVYDFNAEKQISLPKHWEGFDYSPNEDKIVVKSIGLDPENRWLAVMNDDGSQSKKIESIGTNADKVIPSWSPNNQTIAMYIEGVDFDRQEVYFVGLNNENYKSTIIEGRGFDPKWSPNGEKLLYSVYSSKTNLNPELWIVNAQGDYIGSGRKDLNISTWANKCSFANNEEIYCAIPKELPEGAGLMPELADNSIYELYKVNINTGSKNLVAIPEGNFNISNIIISKDGNNLFFTDNFSKKLYKIKLK